MANVAQLRYSVAANVDELGGEAEFRDLSILGWLNEAQSAAWHVMRLAREDHCRRLMLSTDGIQTIFGYRYDPASLRLVPGTRFYTLPPDFFELKSLRVVTSGREHVVFHPGDEGSDRWNDVITRSVMNAGWIANSYYFDVVDRRTLSLAPIVRETLDIELLYVRKWPKMREYATGTITRTNGSAVYAGTNTAWIDQGIVAGSEVLAAVNSRLGIDPTAQYPVINTVTNNTSLTVEEPFTGTTDPAGVAYIIASVPEVPEPYHPAMVEYATIRAKAKSRNVDRSFWAALAQQLFGMMTDGVESRQEMENEQVEGYLEGFL